MPEKIGYARVSTEDQNLQRQLDWFDQQDVTNIYTDKLSGKNLDRQGFQAAIAALQPGDILYVESLSRISRSMKDLLNILDELEKKQVTIVSLHDPIDFSTPDGRLMTGIIASMNEYQRLVMLERQRGGIESAKKRGVYKGRPKDKDGPEIFDALWWWSAGHSLRESAEKYGLSTKKLKNRIDQYQIEQNDMKSARRIERLKKKAEETNDA